MNFIRFDPKTGDITSYGEMDEKHIDKYIEDGEYMIKTNLLYPSGQYRVDVPFGGIPDMPAEFKIDYSTFKIVEYTPYEPPTEEMIKENLTSQIDGVLSVFQSLHPDDPAWQSYFSSLESAKLAPVSQEMIASIPSTDPTGIDMFSNFRQFA